MFSEILNTLKKKKVLIILLILSFILISIVLILVLTKKEEIVVEEKKKETEETTFTMSTLEEDLVYTQETKDFPSWINDNGQGPWYQDLYIAYSINGLDFTGEKLYIPHSGVGNLILGNDEEIIATFQYFSYENQELFDKICYTTSTDGGLTWSSIKKVNISGLPQGPNAVDPTLVLLEDGKYRLYFTYETYGDGNPQLYSALGESMDSEFVNEGKQLEVDSIILDPAVIYFNGMYHHYTVSHEGDEERSMTSFHSISETGLDFEEVGTFTEEIQFLGDVVLVDDGLRFYGSGMGIQSAFSTDGYTWTMDEGKRVDGADPGVVKLTDGSYVIIYTGVGAK